MQYYFVKKFAFSRVVTDQKLMKLQTFTLGVRYSDFILPFAFGRCCHCVVTGQKLKWSSIALVNIE